MSFINYNAKEIHCKIVYYGPSLGGKTTNIQWVYQTLAADQKSKLVALNTEIERTLFFDFLPLEVGEIRGFQTRFHLYTVPGQVIYDASRKLILKGLDGVVFVVDSQADRLEENIASMKNLEKNLEQQGYNIKDVPLLIQYNKRDLPNSMPIAELRRHINRHNAPEVEAVAFEGKGVLESFKLVSKNVIQVLKGGAAV
ncbi:MAG: gliding-motility protein MglA [Bdellovibrionales bacterium RIFCSPHIGHO2_01_FULL_40_29]|nr:MAG: gliding-motility protein MglA [Bdellovibrionales bacterium RIFCSPHIGHO2_01_FULL_40_29]OFZ34813.1 MAG: gliding-motility protein MglA [Bdellovibrionales bacterium RIFCSPHIGHO2_02_FULL_40_15]